MTHRFVISIALFAALSLAGCADPFLLVPGGQLQGPVAEAPESWSATDEIDTIQFETNPTEPYSVNIWVTALGPNLYVHAGANRATWVEHMENDPRVRIRVEETIYELDASRVNEQSEFDRFSDAYETKYGTRPRNENVSEAYLFRLAPRG